MRFEHDYTYLLGRMDLVDVILPDLGITVVSQRGSEITCRCPDWQGNHTHGDATPSFGINEDTGLWTCFVCASGNLVQLVSQCLGLNLDDSLLWLEEHSDLAPSSTEDFRNEIERILSHHEEALEPLPDYPPDLLFQYEGFHPWLSDRGISKEVAEEMQIGFDPGHCGIVIPVFFKEKLVGMQYRHLGQNSKGEYICPERCFQQRVPQELRGTGVPKYKNSSHFPASIVVYNYDNALREGTKVIVVESPMSVNYLKSNGIHNVVATFGNGISALQCQLLYPFVDGVYMWQDNDTAGNKSRRDLIRILRDFVPIWFVPLVPGEKADPGDVLPDQIQTYLDSAYSLSEYQMEGVRVGV